MTAGRKWVLQSMPRPTPIAYGQGSMAGVAHQASHARHQLFVVELECTLRCLAQPRFGHLLLEQLPGLHSAGAQAAADARGAVSEADRGSCSCSAGRWRRCLGRLNLGSIEALGASIAQANSR